MEKLIYRRSEVGYLQDGCHGDSIGHLEVFLDEIGRYVLGFKRWAINPQEVVSDLEFCTVRKDGSFIVIAAKNDDNATENSCDVFKIEDSCFVPLLDRWRELQFQMPQRIIFEYEGSKCIVYGEEFPVLESAVFASTDWRINVGDGGPQQFNLDRLPDGIYAWSGNLWSTQSMIPFFIFGDLDWRGTKFFKEWATNDHDVYFIGDSCLIMKQNKNIFIKALLYFKDPEYLALTRGQFLNMLERWDVLLLNPPEKVRVHCKNGDITFER